MPKCNSISKINRFTKGNFIFWCEIYFVEQEIPSRFCLQFNTENLLSRMLFKNVVNKEKTIQRFNVKLLGVSYFIKAWFFVSFRFVDIPL